MKLHSRHISFAVFIGVILLMLATVLANALAG
jgi:hypothetical protein